MKTLLQIFSQKVSEGPGSEGTTTHLLEILIMLVGAFVLGYLLRLTLDRLKGAKVADLRRENRSLNELIEEQSKLNTSIPAEDRTKLEERIAMLDRSNDLLKKDLERCTNDRSRLEVQLKEAQRISEPKKEEPLLVSSPRPVKGSITESLRKIEGIGPKIEELLHAAGYRTFLDLSQANVEDLKKVLAAANPAYKVHDPSTWPEQAILASEDRWDELHRWQKDLKGGKRV